MIKIDFKKIALFIVIRTAQFLAFFIYLFRLAYLLSELKLEEFKSEMSKRG